MPLGQRRQDADHHHVGADVGGLGLGLVEAVSQGLLEGGQPALAQPGGRHVDLDVELPELGLELRVRDRGQRLGVLQRRVAQLVDQVELHLEAGHRVVGVEARLAQHPGEDVEAATHLLAVPRAVRPGELLQLHLFAHAGTLRRVRPIRGRYAPPQTSSLRRTRSSTTPAMRAGALVRRPLARRSPGRRAPARDPRRPARRPPTPRAPRGHGSTTASSTSPRGGEPAQHGVHQGVVEAEPGGAPVGGPQRLGAPGGRLVTLPPAPRRVLDQAAHEGRQQHRVGRVGADVEDPHLDGRLPDREPGVEVEHPGVASGTELLQLPAQLLVGRQRQEGRSSARRSASATTAASARRRSRCRVPRRTASSR